MRYATWQLYWQPDERYGSGPESEIGEVEGIFFTGHDPYDTIVGYVYSNHDLIGLENWNVQEITGEQALALAQQLDGDASMDDEGRIVFPMPSLSV
jgi:hypothetical protein